MSELRTNTYGEFNMKYICLSCGAMFDNRKRQYNNIYRDYTPEELDKFKQFGGYALKGTGCSSFYPQFDTGKKDYKHPYYICPKCGGRNHKEISKLGTEDMYELYGECACHSISEHGILFIMKQILKNAGVK